MKKIIKTLSVLSFLFLLTNVTFAETTNDLKSSTPEEDLTGDYIVSISRNINKEFSVSTSATLDLQNNTLTYKDNDTLFIITGTFYVKNGTLAVHEDKTGSLFGTSSPGKLILENVKLSSSGYLPTYYECKIGTYNFSPAGHLDLSTSGIGYYYNDDPSDPLYTVDYEYTVTFDFNNGESASGVKVFNNKTVSKPSQNPSKSGYSFDCWQLDDEEYDFTSSVSGNLTLKAKYTANSSETQNSEPKESEKEYNSVVVQYQVVNTGVSHIDYIRYRLYELIKALFN